MNGLDVKRILHEPTNVPSSFSILNLDVEKAVNGYFRTGECAKALNEVTKNIQVAKPECKR